MYEIKVVYASVGLTVESQYFKKSVNSYSPDVPFAESLRTDSLTFVLSTLADFTFVISPELKSALADFTFVISPELKSAVNFSTISLTLALRAFLMQFSASPVETHFKLFNLCDSSL